MRFICFIMVLLLSTTVYAFPPIAAEYYGKVYVHGHEASVGTRIEAYDEDGILCGAYEVSNNGNYGLLSCNGDDQSTDVDEGALEGDNIYFVIGEILMVAEGNVSWEQGAFREVNLYVGEELPLPEKPVVIINYRRLVLETLVLLIILFSIIFIMLNRNDHPRKMQ